MTDLTAFLEQLHSTRLEGSIVVATMTQGLLWPEVSDSPYDICFVAPMGSAAPLGLGIALAQPGRRVVVIDGDGSLLMNLGATVTIGAEAPENLVHIVVANGGYRITGGHPLPGRGPAQLRELAHASDYKHVHACQNPEALTEDDVKAVWSATGPVFITAEVESEFPRATLAQVTHSAQALSTQGPAGYRNLHNLLAGTA